MKFPLLLGRDILGDYLVDVSRRVDGDTAQEEKEDDDEWISRTTV